MYDFRGKSPCADLNWPARGVKADDVGNATAFSSDETARWRVSAGQAFRDETNLGQAVSTISGQAVKARACAEHGRHDVARREGGTEVVRAPSYSTRQDCFYMTGWESITTGFFLPGSEYQSRKNRSRGLAKGDVPSRRP